MCMLPCMRLSCMLEASRRFHVHQASGRCKNHHTELHRKGLTSRTETSKVPPPRSKTRMVSLDFFSNP